MKQFQTRFSGGRGVETIQIPPDREALWSAAFGVESVDDIFDLDTPATAIPKLDSAIARFNHDPDSLRPLCTRGTLVRARMVLEQVRDTLANHPDASISGAVDVPAPA